MDQIEYKHKNYNINIMIKNIILNAIDKYTKKVSIKYGIDYKELKELLNKSPKDFRSKDKNGENEVEDVKYIIYSLNTNNELGNILKTNFYKIFNKNIVKTIDRDGNNRKKHYDFIIVDEDNNKYQVEHKGSKTFKRIRDSDMPWKTGVQYANMGAEKYKITEKYAKIWYNEYIISGLFKEKFNLKSSIPTFNTWYKSDCCTQGNPKTLFGIELKSTCKSSNISLLDYRKKVNSIMVVEVLSNEEILKEFSNTVLELTNKCLSNKDYWLQINGDLKDVEKISFKWYPKIIIENLNEITFSIKTDIDFHIEYEGGLTLNPKLRWGKGCGFSNLRIDLK